ncbi:sensor histidine kinase [Falsirhodobacter deserti]|uniref:sensor histidine kinase n=1 Tax=Falsirhodobacter deserti TaxID=1365611 RepID=UPI000FE2EBD4|nr:HWE histidine kinase domain-containing protein [Falsirhodobacter deserti]
MKDVLQVRPIQILLLEDSELDADLVVAHLQRAGIEHDVARVWTREDFTAALQDEPDLILADHTLPAFDGMSALDIAQDICPRIPFVFVSATLGEEIAVEAMKRGATDYVIKSRLTRLPGCVIRALAEARERKARLDAEEALLSSRRRLDAALDIARLGTFEWRSDTDQLLMDERACEIILGRQERMADLLALIHEMEQPSMHEALNCIAREGGKLEREITLRSAEGEMRNVMLICDHATGTSAYGILFDVTERRAAERQQLLIMRELHHRVKNSLASVQSIINFTLRTSETKEEFAFSIRRRIRSLATSHTLLTDSDWSGIHLRAIVMSELQPYDPRRVRLDGPDLQLPAEMALSFALAVHEMTTNAAKYGALSVPGGKVCIEWDLADKKLSFNWRESGGPLVHPPVRRGFGSILLEQALGQQIDGNVRQDFHPDGLRIEIIAPLD